MGRTQGATRVFRGQAAQIASTACFWAWCFLWTSNAGNADWPIASPESFPFVRLSFWIGNGLGLAIVALVLGAKKEVANRPFIVASAFVQVAGSAATVLLRDAAPALFPALAVASFAAGLACVCYLPGWRKAVAELPARESVMFVGSAACLALLLFYALLLLPKPVAMVVFVLLPLASGVCALVDGRDEARAYTMDVRPPEGDAVRSARAFKAVYIALTMLVLAVMGLDTLGYHGSSASDGRAPLVAGFALALALSALFALAHRNRDVERYLVVPYMPLAVAFAFLAPFFFTDSGTLLQMAVSLDFACWCFLIAIGIDSVVQTKRSRAVHGVVLGACPAAAFAAQAALGAGGFDATLSAGTYAILLATAVLVMFRISFTAQREAAAADDREAVAALVAAEHGLSPRETEVFVLLAYGHGQTYIQERLFIAPGTVKTHVKHIYAKLGIRNREELLSLVQEAASRLF